jgi:SAM-dependent methyltransferase
MVVTKPSRGIDPRLLNLLVCPRDHSDLNLENEQLKCAHGHVYPIVDGIPVFLVAEKEQTLSAAAASLRAAETGIGDPLYVDTLGLSEEQKRGVERAWKADNKVDAAISYLIGATSGLGYVQLIGRLESYPIPRIPVANGNGKLLLDVGSNWGRWSVSAAQKGWRVVGIDPSLGALLAAQRAFSRMAPDLAFVCGDARYLPFKSDTFQGAFSYSVIQHFSEIDAEIAVAEVGRVLCPGGFAKIQMAHKGGLRSIYSSTRPNYAEGGPFRVRYWSLAALRNVFEQRIGPTILIAEGFGGLGLLAEDRPYVSNGAKFLITISTLLKGLSLRLNPLIRLADSVYVLSTKR